MRYWLRQYWYNMIINIIMDNIARVKNKRKQKDRQILGYCERAEKAVEDESDSDINCSWCSWNSS